MSVSYQDGIDSPHLSSLTTLTMFGHRRLCRSVEGLYPHLFTLSPPMTARRRGPWISVSSAFHLKGPRLASSTLPVTTVKGDVCNLLGPSTPTSTSTKSQSLHDVHKPCVANLVTKFAMGALTLSSPPCTLSSWLGRHLQGLGGAAIPTPLSPSPSPIYPTPIPPTSLLPTFSRHQSKDFSRPRSLFVEPNNLSARSAIHLNIIPT